MCKRLLVLLLLQVGFVSQPALACVCTPPDPKSRIIDMIAEAVERADLIFEGQVESIQYEKANVDDEETEPYIQSWSVDFEAVHIYKGEAQLPIRLTNINSTCDYYFEVGVSYLVYAFEEAPKQFATAQCMRTSPLVRAQADLRYLRGELPKREDLLTWDEDMDVWKKHLREKTGVVCGRVFRSDGGALPPGSVNLWRADVPMTQNPSTSSSLEEDGSYRIEWVRPGQYRLSVDGDRINGERVVGVFGGGVNLEEADVIEVEPGSETCDLNVVVHSQEIVSVSGLVRPRDGSRLPEGPIVVVLVNAVGNAVPTAIIEETSPSGHFVLEGVLPGSYEIHAWYGVQNGRRSSKREHIDVDTELRTIVLEIPPLPN